MTNDIVQNTLKAKTVIAVDTRQEPLDAARDAGADHTVLSDGLTEYLTKNAVVIDTACDFVGLTSTFQAALAAIRPKGTVHVVGMFAFSLELPSIQMLMKDATIRGSTWGTKKELAEVLEIMRVGHVKPVIETRPMSTLPDALDDMKQNRPSTTGRMVFLPD